MMNGLASWIFPGFMNLIVVLLMALQPYIAARAVLFGVFVPDADRKEAVVISLRRRFTIAVCTGGVAAFAAGVVLARNVGVDPAVLLPGVIALQLGIVCALYVLFRRAALRLKKERNWQVPPAGKRVASLQFRKQPTTITSRWFAVHVAVAVVSAGIAALMWDRIPDTIISHYNAQGVPDGYSEKSFGSVFLINIIQLLLSGLFVWINAIISSSRQLLDPNEPERSMARDVRFRKLNSAFLWALSLGIVLLFTCIQASMIYQWPQKTIFITLVTVSVVLVVSVAVFIIYMARKNAIPQTDAAYVEDRLWRGGGNFYYNKNDPALFVQKRVGIGWTLNFAQPASWLILGGMLGVPVLILVLTAVLS